MLFVHLLKKLREKACDCRSLLKGLCKQEIILTMLSKKWSWKQCISTWNGLLCAWLWVWFSVCSRLPPPSPALRETTWGDFLIRGGRKGERGSNRAVSGPVFLWGLLLPRCVTCSGAFVWEAEAPPIIMFYCLITTWLNLCLILFSRDIAHYWTQTKSAPGCFSSAVPGHWLMRHPQWGRRNFQ